MLALVPLFVFSFFKLINRPNLPTLTRYEASFLECDLSGMTCFATNVFYMKEMNAFFIAAGSSAFRYAGQIVNFGIGKPSAIGYLDTWTFMSKSNGGWLKAAIRGIRKFKEEQEYNPKGLFVPIYVTEVDFFDSNLISNLGNGLVFEILWRDNFFRTIYSGAVAKASTLRWKEFTENRKISYFTFNEKEVGEYLFGKMESIPKGIVKFDRLIIGLYKGAMLEEQALMMPDAPNFEAIAHSYQKYKEELLEKLLSRTIQPSGTVIIQRKGNRKVITDSKYDQIQLEGRSLEEQVNILNQFQVLIAAHGAALTHLFVIKNCKDTLIVELFPCGFRKTIYQNLALLLGIKYVYWQQTDNCKENICGREIDWNDQTSKDCWRNQDITISNDEFERILAEARKVDNEKYLMYMPWERLNNQLIAFKCSCGVAKILNRTLVIPPIGHRLDQSISNRVVFDSLAYKWEPFLKYFGFDDKSLPCKIIDYRSFYSLTRKVDRIYFRRQGAKYTTRIQVEQFYYFIAGLTYEQHRSLLYEMPVYMNSDDVRDYLGKYEKLKVLALGNAFWLYNFDQPLQYPVFHYVDMMQSKTYSDIIKGMKFSPKLEKIKRGILNRLGSNYGCVHWRQGDYETKCREEFHPHRCFVEKFQLFYRTIETHNTTWFLSTNGPLLDPFVNIHNLIDVGDLDPIEMVLLDQLVCTEAKYFVGNMYSSLTRTVIDFRISKNRSYELF
jgi:hypothetical protein